jgi:hypothetical protein
MLDTHTARLYGRVQEGVPMNELSGIELRAAVAERVMGWKRSERFSDMWTQNGSTYMRLPHYESDIAAAMEVAEAMRARGYSFLLNIPDPAEPRTWWAEFADTTSIYDDGLEYQDTAPLAICRAALAALEEAQ